MLFGSSIDLSPVLVLFQNWKQEKEVGSSSTAPSEAFAEQLHHALRCLLHTTIELTDSLSMLVVRNFTVCACIIPESPAYNSMERPYYLHADADDASPILAALHYSVWSVAVHDVGYIRHKFRWENRKVPVRWKRRDFLPPFLRKRTLLQFPFEII